MEGSMRRGKNGRKRKKRWCRFTAMSILLLIISGCRHTQEESELPKISMDILQVTETLEDDSEEIVSILQPIYKKAVEEDKTDDLETIRSIVACLGENGYPSVDSKNQVNMTWAGQVEHFCEIAKAKKKSEITIIEVGYQGSFTVYDLQSENGKVDVAKTYYKYEEGSIQRKVTENYHADNWEYTKEGYLIFSGVWFSEEMYVLTLGGTEEHTALRVKPLDETCRELNRQYLLPIGYEQNNMFLVDWSEKDYQKLNFYDMYDIFYPKVTGKDIPYLADENLSIESVYQIPKDEFEQVIMQYFQIDSQTLQSKTIYHTENSTYEYMPRSFEETEYPEYPYPEVVKYKQNSDGTIKLTVHVVYPYEDTSKVYTHEVVVRPLENNRVQYVSNKICPSKYNYRTLWHTPRKQTSKIR